MELFLEAGQNYAFLVELVIHYLKLTERRQVKIIYLSAVTLDRLREPSKPLKINNWESRFHPSSRQKEKSKQKSFQYANDFSRFFLSGKVSSWVKVNKRKKFQRSKLTSKKESSSERYISI